MTVSRSGQMPQPVQRHVVAGVDHRRDRRRRRHGPQAGDGSGSPDAPASTTISTNVIVPMGNLSTVRRRVECVHEMWTNDP
jgi:hypothetical protein